MKLCGKLFFVFLLACGGGGGNSTVVVDQSNEVTQEFCKICAQENLNGEDFEACLSGAHLTIEDCV